MSLSKYEQARQLIYEARDESDFEGEKAELLVLKTEHALGLMFPPSYRSFLKDFGCGSIYGIEIYGLIDSNFYESSIPNGVWLTLNERKVSCLPHQYILIGELGEGSYYAIDTSVINNCGENPVVLISVDFKRKKEVYDSFGAYLLNIIQAERS